MTSTTDAIRLTVPYERPYQGVVRLVVGGLAARLDLPFEVLEDVQLAVEALLGNDAYAADETVTLEVEVADSGLRLALGPLEPAALAIALEGDDASGVGLARILETVMSTHSVEQRDAGGWLRMEKALPQAEATA